MNKSLYFLSKGELIIKDSTICFINENNEKVLFPIKQVEDLYLNINNKCTPNLLSLLLKEGIYVHYFNNYEYYIGSVIPAKTKFSGKLLLEEIKHYSDDKKRLFIAKEMLVASIKNINRTMKYYYNKDVVLKKININLYINNISNVKEINELRLIEAEVRKKYYSVFPEILNIEHFNRNFNSNDIVNVLLNFFNSLLYSLIFSEIMKTKISGKIGFIHELADNRYPLIYDLADIFKPLIVDRLIFKLINRNQVSNNDIIKGKLTDEIIKKLFEQWNKQINTVIHHKTIKKHMSYRRLIREEIYKLERHINNKEQYKGFVLWW
jgi:CRISPR-associated protein Cas1